MSAAPQGRGILTLSVLAVGVGVVAGLGAWVFRALIGLFHNLVFFGRVSADYDATVHTPSDVLGLWVIAIPVVGAVGVAWLVKTFAPEAKGHGVPEVMDAIYYADGKIRPVVVVVKSLASALSIGSGGSIGREGPIIQIGAAIGSLLGQWIAMPPRQRIVLVAGGAGAGIAATFNAPLGGILFTVELLLVSINAWSMLLVTLSTVVATYIGRLLMGASPAFDIPALQIPRFAEVPALELVIFVPLGIVVGLGAAAFIRMIYWAEDRFDALPGNYYSRHVLGMATVGLMIYLIQRYAGHYYVEGVGYATIADILARLLSDPGFLLLLFALKFAATGLTLGSGASGGIFSPSLFMGACLGAAFGEVMQAFVTDHSIGVAAYAIAGMAAMIGASTGALFTSIVMVFEMTGDSNSVLPILLCTVTAYGVRKSVCAPSIYTLKLARRGHVVPEGLMSATLPARRLSDIMNSDVRVVGDPSDGAGDVVVVARDGRIHEICGPGIDARAGRGARGGFVLLTPETPLSDALRTMEDAGAEFAVVTEAPDGGRAESVRGVVSARELLTEMKRTARLH